MTRPATPRSPAIRRRSPLRHRLHRKTGVAAGLVIFYLIATGLPLQLTAWLGLGSTYVTSPTLLDWYGIHAPDAGRESNGVRFVGNQLFVDGSRIADASGFQGAVRLRDLVIVAAGDELLLFPAADPAVLETVHPGGPIRRIGYAGRDVVVDTAGGLHRLDPETLEPGPVLPEPLAVTWAETRQLDPASLRRYANLARSRILTIERLLQDLHSGRAFGAAGEWLINLASIGLAVLVLSGYWIWWRSR